MRIIDMHCDTIHKIWQEKGENLASDKLMLNIFKMKQGGYSVQNFAMFIEAIEEVEEAAHHANMAMLENSYDDMKGIYKGIDCFKRFDELLSVFDEQMNIFADSISKVTKVSEILENEREGRLSAFLTVEGGEACQGDIKKLHYLYEQGVRMMTLTWNFPNELGYPNIDRRMLLRSNAADMHKFTPYTPDTVHGLTNTGIEFVREMERIGMIIDVSHLSDAGFYDVLENTEKPFAASHSNSREVCPFVRNLTDDMIRSLGERGGVTGLNYCRDFLFTKEEIETMDAEMAVYDFERQDKEYKLVTAYDKKKNVMSYNERKELEEKYMIITCDKLAEHARHIVNVGGMGVLGLGSDFDGIPSYMGMPKADKLDHLAHALHKQGFSYDQIDSIFYGNVMRLYGEILK